MAEQETVLEETSGGTESQQAQVVELSEEESYSKEQVEQIVKSALDKEIAGLKSNNSALKEEKKKAQAKVNDFSDLVNSLGGEEGIKGLVDLKTKIDQDEELRLFTSGDREKYNARILNRAQQDHAAQLKNVIKEKEDWEKVATEAISRYQTRETEKAVLDGCAEAGVNPRLYKAMSAQVRDDIIFDPDSDKVLVKDGDGIRYGKDGSPMEVAELIETLREDQPELFLKSTGSSAFGSTTTRRGSSITQSDISRMSLDEYKRHRESGAIR